MSEKGVEKALIAFFGGIAIGMTTLGFGIKGIIGATDKQNAEEFLKGESYKIESYEGKAGFFERERSYYSDKFNVISPNGSKKTVIVTRGMFSDVQHIGFVKPD